MKTLFCAVLICMSFSMAKGQCLDDNDFRMVSSCDGSVRSGSYVFVDMNKIGRPCTCTVNSLFVGDLLVTSYKVTTHLCNTRVIVNNTAILYCNQTISSTFKVEVNDILIVRTEYMAGNSKDGFKQCVGFSENGGRGGTLSVTCGTLPSWTTTPTFYTTTTSSTLHIIVGSAAGGAIILVGLVVVILISMKMKRSRSAENKERSSEVDKAHKNEIFDSNPELPDNLLYLSLQPLDELEINSNYDVLLINKPIDHDASSMPVNAVPKRSRDDTPEVSAGDVYVNL